ncbi:MAG: hypothetical protein K8R88_06970 [Armatimonadetes bacterium]|nr:hypothetical protein [Armatimonadota bacterium]
MSDLPLDQVSFASLFDLDIIGSPGIQLPIMDAARKSREPGGLRMTKPALLEFCNKITQLVDGEIKFFAEGKVSPLFQLVAFDSTEYELESEDPAILQTLSKRNPHWV